MADKLKIRRKLIIEGLMAFFIALTPLLFYFYKYIPKSAKTTWEFFWINFSNNGYADVPTAFYFYLGKFIPLALLIIWFATCKQWWYHVILIPIAMYAFQLYSVLSEDIKRIDENEILYLLAVCMIVIPIVYFIRVKLFDKHVHGIDLEAMDAELRAYKEKEKMDKKPNHFERTVHVVEPNDHMDDSPDSNKSNNFISDFQGKLEKMFDIKH